MGGATGAVPGAGAAVGGVALERVGGNEKN